MSAVGNQTPRSTASDYATTQFIVSQILLGMCTTQVVRVMKCTNNGDVAPVGRVDVAILVDMILENGETIPHGTVFDVPYNRLQGGAFAVIIDPKSGDLGACVFCMRDISAVKANPTAARDRTPAPGAPPGSGRVYEYSDALYIGGWMNGTPTQYVQLNDDGITVHSPVRVHVTAPSVDVEATTEITLKAPTINLQGEVVQTDGNVSMAQNLTVQGDIEVPTGQVTVQGIGATTHKHPTAPPGPESPPVP